jgi:hypothetical protein
MKIIREPDPAAVPARLELLLWLVVVAESVLLFDQATRLAAAHWLPVKESINLPAGFFLMQNRDYLTPVLLADLPRKIFFISLFCMLGLAINHQLERYAYVATLAMGLTLGGLLSNAFSFAAYAYVLNWLGFDSPFGGGLIFVPADFAQLSGLGLLGGLFSYLSFLRLRQIIVNHWRKRNGLPALE